MNRRIANVRETIIGHPMENIIKRITITNKKSCETIRVTETSTLQPRRLSSDPAIDGFVYILINYESRKITGEACYQALYLRYR